MAGVNKIEMSDQEYNELVRVSGIVLVAQGELAGQQAGVEFLQTMTDKQRDTLAMYGRGEVGAQKVLDEYLTLMAVLDDFQNGCSKQLVKTSTVLKDAETVLYSVK